MPTITILLTEKELEQLRSNFPPLIFGKLTDVELVRAVVHSYLEAFAFRDPGPTPPGLRQIIQDMRDPPDHTAGPKGPLP